MGQGSDEIKMNDPNATYVMRPDSVEGDVSPTDIEHTRAEMSGTLSALGDKLNPHALGAEAKDVAQDTTRHAKEAVLEVVDHAKEALPGIISGATDHAKGAVKETVVAATDHAKEAVVGATDHAKEAATEVVAQARDTVTDLVEQLRTALPEAVGHAARNAVSHAVDEAKQAVSKGVHTTLHGAKTALSGAAEGAKNAASGASQSLKTAITKTGIDATAPKGAGVTAQGITMTLTERIKDNPPAALLAGLGLYLLFRGAGSKAATPRTTYTDSDLTTSATKSGASRVIGAAGDKISDAGDKISDAAEGVQQKASDAAGHVQDAASNVAGHVQDAASSLGTQVQEKAHQGGDAFERLLQDNPLVVAGIGLGIGALVGLALPSTTSEQHLMGEASGALVQKAQDAVQDKVQDLNEKVHSAVGVAGDAVSTIKESVSK